MVMARPSVHRRDETLDLVQLSQTQTRLYLYLLLQLQEAS